MAARGDACKTKQKLSIPEQRAALGRPAFSGSQTVIQATRLFHRKEKRVPSPEPSPPGPIHSTMKTEHRCRPCPNPWPWPPNSISPSDSVSLFNLCPEILLLCVTKPPNPTTQLRGNYGQKSNSNFTAIWARAPCPASRISSVSVFLLGTQASPANPEIHRRVPCIPSVRFELQLSSYTLQRLPIVRSTDYLPAWTPPNERIALICARVKCLRSVGSSSFTSP